MKVPIGTETQPWITHVVMSTLPAGMLPTSLNKPGAKRLCQVKSRLPGDMKLKNSKWYQRSDAYFKAEFDVRVLIGAADLRFQTLDRHGVLNQDHGTIDVDWYATPTSIQSPNIHATELSTGDSMGVHTDLWTDPKPNLKDNEKRSNRLARRN